MVIEKFITRCIIDVLADCVITVVSDRKLIVGLERPNNVEPSIHRILGCTAPTTTTTTTPPTPTSRFYLISTVAVIGSVVICLGETCLPRLISVCE